MKISKRETILIVVIIFIISAAAYYVYFLTPTLKSIDNLAISIEQKQFRILSMLTAIDQIDNVKNEITNLEAELDKQSENIPSGISQPLQLVALTNIMNSKSDHLVIIFNQSLHEFENYQKNIVDISFSTTYGNLLLIFDDFKNLNMANQVVDMNVLLSQDLLTYYTGVLQGNYLLVGMSIEFFSFYKDPSAGPLERQPFEDSPIEYKNPFRSTLN